MKEITVKPDEIQLINIQHTSIVPAPKEEKRRKKKKSYDLEMWLMIISVYVMFLIYFFT